MSAPMGSSSHLPEASVHSASPDALLERLAASGLHARGGGSPWPERRHPDPFAPPSPEPAAVEAAAQEQLR
jgi:hypothetical protein